MQTLSTLQFQGQPAARPTLCKYNLHYSQTLQYRSADIVSQHYHFNPEGVEKQWSYDFIINHTEVQQKTHTRIPFSIASKQLLLFFMLEGSCILHGKEGQPLSIAQNTFQFCMLQPGEYHLEVAAGYHIVSVISIENRWLRKCCQWAAPILQILRQFIDEKQHARISAPCRLSPIVRKLLSDVYRSASHRDAIEDNLRASISSAIGFYHKVITEGDLTLAEELKLYIDQNYHNPDLNLEMLTEMFNETPQKLNTHFKSKYGQNVSEYYTHVRIKHARYELRFWGGSVAGIYKSVGYRSAESLRSALKKSGYRRKSDRSD